MHYSDLINNIFDKISPEWRQLLEPDIHTVILALFKEMRPDLKFPKTRIADNYEIDCADLKYFEPPISEWFEFARRTPIDRILCVICGQDPYPANGANGLAFSSKNSTADGVIPPSLRNIYKCLIYSNLMSQMPNTCDLTPWAEQGILLLNAALTTKRGVTRAHTKIWEEYTNKLILHISKIKCSGHAPIFVLWGEDAKKKKALLNGNVVFEWGHPSPLGRSNFNECDSFINVNLALSHRGFEPINWDLCGSGAAANNVAEVKSIEQNTSSANAAGIDELKSTINNILIFDHRYPLGTRISSLPENVQLIFTDGSCEPNNGSPASRAGYAAMCADGPYKNYLLLGNLSNEKYMCSNIRAECSALCAAMHFAKQKKIFAIIATDSEFWLKMLNEYIPNWSESKKATCKNADLVREISGLYAELKKNILLVYVPAHNKKGWGNYAHETDEYYCHYYNELADIYATHARKQIERGTNRKIKLIGK